MTKKAGPSAPFRGIAQDGYRPTETHGHQPIAVRPTGTVSNGHQPTTSQGPAGSPPNQGSGGQGGGKK